MSRKLPRVITGPLAPAVLVLVAGVVVVLALTRQGTLRGTSVGDPLTAVSWHETIEVAAGEAFVSPWRMNDSEWRYVDDPAVAIDRDGFVGVAWVDQSRKDVFFQLYDPDGEALFERPVNVSRSPGIFSWLPRVSIGSGDPRQVHLLWQEIVFSGGSHGGEIFFARSIDGGRSFGRPVNLSKSTAGDGKGRLTPDLWHNGSLDLALGPGGALYAAWTEYEGALWFSRSTDGGESFSTPVRVAGGRGALPARGPSLGVNPGGRIYLAWAVGEDPAADIRLATSDDGGRSFGEPRVPFKSSGHADAPKLAVDDKGILHVVWAESRGGYGRSYHVRYARSADGGRTFEPPLEISDKRAAFESASFPALSVDARGNMYVVWELFPDRHGPARGLGFVYSRNRGRTFSSPRGVPGTADPDLGVNGSRQGPLMRKLAVNENGAMAVVNSTFREGRESRIRLFRGALVE